MALNGRKSEIESKIDEIDRVRTVETDEFSVAVEEQYALQEACGSFAQWAGIWAAKCPDTTDKTLKAEL